VSDVSGEERIGEFAPADVRAAVGWLKDHRFVLASSDTDRGTFGSLWALARQDAEVRGHRLTDRNGSLTSRAGAAGNRSSTNCSWPLSEVRTTETASRDPTADSQETVLRNYPRE
jgi:hypothetical protein